MKKIFIFIAFVLPVIFIISGCSGGQKEIAHLGVAVEFTDHAASAYIALDKGYFAGAGLNPSVYESYVTGTALAAAMARGDIQVAYICLAPAISAYANAGVPLKIVAGTHKYGYGLAVNPEKIKDVQDLEKPGIRIGCVEAGSAADIMLQKTIDEFGLNREQVIKNVQRMNPPKQILAIKTGKLDAALMPEHWATVAENAGFTMLLTARDIWPGMQGSVLIVKEDLIKNHPEVVKKLVEVSQKATNWANENPLEASRIMASEMQTMGKQVFPADVAETAKQLEITPEIMQRSMRRLEYTTSIDPATIQETIDYMAYLGYIKIGFKAENILDLRFLK
ncbi:MAG: ABC transporter substrate-binding protein [Dehalococcoidales bacterium]|jgi:NitT/TauT family transport system substrate-binding protein|nr:ABC transporter substrate-binding protein [Dehalococcoidales bacterium]